MHMKTIPKVKGSVRHHDKTINKALNRIKSFLFVKAKLMNEKLNEKYIFLYFLFVHKFISKILIHGHTSSSLLASNIPNRNANTWVIDLAEVRTTLECLQNSQASKTCTILRFVRNVGFAGMKFLCNGWSPLSN